MTDTYPSYDYTDDRDQLGWRVAEMRQYERAVSRHLAADSDFSIHYICTIRRTVGGQAEVMKI